MFNFFRRSINSANQKNNSIQIGILFEDSGDFLEWGASTETLAKRLSARIERRADRTEYYWGEHSILNGLHLNLSSMFWKFRMDNFSKGFNTISFWAIGDENAEKYLELISNHLEKEIGEPTRKEGSMPD